MMKFELQNLDFLNFPPITINEIDFLISAYSLCKVQRASARVQSSNFWCGQFNSTNPPSEGDKCS